MTRESALEALGVCRRQIDELDLQLLELLNERAAIVERSAKSNSGRAAHLRTQARRSGVRKCDGPQRGSTLQRCRETRV